MTNDYEEHELNLEEDRPRLGPANEFVCARCKEAVDDTSYEPLCPDCYNETEGEWC